MKEKTTPFVSIFKNAYNLRGHMNIKIFYTNVFLLFFLFSISWSAQIQINTQTGKIGDHVNFTVFIHNSPDPVNAFGLEISYDPTCMIYQSVQRGSLISNGFQFFQASNVGLGRIRIGGIETGDQIIPKQATGSLAIVQFKIIGEKNSIVKLDHLKDDLKTWTTQHGQMLLETDNTDNTDETDETDETVDHIESENMSSENGDLNLLTDRQVTVNSQLQHSSIHSESSDILEKDENQRNRLDSTDLVQSQNSQAKLRNNSSQKHQHVKEKESQQQNTQYDSKNTHRHLSKKKFQVQHDQSLENDCPQHKDEKQIVHKIDPPETLVNQNWGHMKLVDLSAGLSQNPSFSENFLFTIPSYLTIIIVLGLVVQPGILTMLILIYRQLCRNKKYQRNCHSK